MKRVALLLVALWSISCAWAAQRSEEQALQEAQLHFAQTPALHRVPAANDGATLTLSWTALQSNGAPAFYVFTRGEKGGWVMISAEDQTRTFLAYSDTGSFDLDDVPANASAWIERYIQEIEYAAQIEIDCDVANVAPQRAKVSKTYTPVTPICTTQWGQGAPYNQLCPLERGERCVTGCVATAVAQLMKVHNYPTHGIGDHSYTWKTRDGDSTILYADFAHTTYDWASMIDNYRATSSTPAQEAAVATLMYHCGIACEMEYSASSSGANSLDMLNALITHFDYDPGIRTLALEYMSEEMLVDSIAADLAAGRPVFMRGRTLNNSSHAFICDGIDANGLLHINWGWNGSSDAYYRVSVLNPKSQGIGGSPIGDAYTMQVLAFTHIQPNQNHQPVYTITGERMYFESLRMDRNTAPSFTIDTMENISANQWEGHLGIMLYKDGQLYNTYYIQDVWSLRVHHYFHHSNMYQYFTNLPNGQYELVPAVTSNTQGQWFEPIYIKGIGECRCPMTVTSDSIILSVPQANAPVDPIGDWDPTTYPYSRMDNYYHYGAGSGGYEWNIQVSTSNFYSQDSLSTEALLLFTIQSGSDHSVLGSYTMDGSNTNKCLQASVYTGTSKYNSRHRAQAGECTVTYDSNKYTYVMDYYIKLYGKTFVGQISIPVSYTRARLVDANNNYSNWTLDNSYYSGLSVSQAVARVHLQGAGVYSLIPYAVQGEISRLNNTPAEMLQYTNCRLFISDGVQTIYAFNTKWLNNTAYATGHEIAVGGKAVIVGKLLYYQGTTPEIYAGYFCAYETPQDEAIETTFDTQEQKVQKVVRNGQILILRNGEVYTLQGIRLND